jgi:hypothetical protein
MLALILIIIGIASRIIIHSPNFTSVIAVALFSGVYLKKQQAVVVPLALMILSDLVLGFHDTIIFTWGSVVLISLIGVFIKKNKKVSTIAMTAVASSVLFFIITNFGAWLSPLYPDTWQGLQDCFIAAIPFYRNTFLSTMAYSVILFGVYEIVASRVKSTRWANFLLA